MDLKWIRDTILGIFVITAALMASLWGDLMNPAYRGATIQGIASVVSAVVTILLLGLTFKSTQRAEQAESEAREVIENAKKQAAAMEALAKATHEQSRILQESLKPNMVLRLQAENIKPSMNDNFEEGPCLTALQYVNLSDGIIYIQHLEYWRNREHVKPILVNGNARALKPGESYTMSFPADEPGISLKAFQRRYFPLGVAWDVNFKVTYTYQKTAGIEHTLAGTISSKEGQDPTLKFFWVDWVSGDQTAKYRLHTVGSSFQSEQFT